MTPIAANTIMAPVNPATAARKRGIGMGVLLDFESAAIRHRTPDKRTMPRECSLEGEDGVVQGSWATEHQG